MMIMRADMIQLVFAVYPKWRHADWWFDIKIMILRCLASRVKQAQTLAVVLPLDEALASRAVFVILSGAEGNAFGAN